MKDMEMQIIMKCSVCGNDQFSVVNEDFEDVQTAPGETELQCSDCGKVTTKEQILSENSYLIDANIEDFKKDIVKQLEKDLKKRFKFK